MKLDCGMFKMDRANRFSGRFRGRRQKSRKWSCHLHLLRLEETHLAPLKSNMKWNPDTKNYDSLTHLMKEFDVCFQLEVEV